MKEVKLGQRVAQELQRHFESVTLAVVTGKVPNSELPRVARLLKRSVQDCSVIGRIEGNLACLQVTEPGGHMRSYPIPVGEAEKLIRNPARQSRIHVGVGAGIMIEQCHQTDEVVATPSCSAGESFLHLVAVD